MDLRTSVSALPTVRDPVANGLARLGIRTVRDLLFHFPRRHEDRRTVLPVREATPGKTIVARGILRDVRAERSFRRYQRGTRVLTVTQAALDDGTGNLPVRWFHQPYLERAYPSGTAVYLVGVVNDEGTLVAPEVERVKFGQQPLHVGRLVPMYPETAGVTSRMLRYLIARVLPFADTLREYLPPATKSAEDLIDFPTAVVQIHFPDDVAALERARRRLAFDELFVLQLAALVRRAARRAEAGLPLAVSESLVEDAIKRLPFSLTPSQVEALRVILADLRHPVPMARLLAGDVGSGKTIVAGLAALAVARASGQTALLAPTEILAQQHADTLTEHLGPAGLRSALLTAATSDDERRSIAVRLEGGALDMVIGTHALLRADLPWKLLALVTVDEQHRFGVEQRGELTRRGPDGATPHFLSLSATPIPRTLQLTALGDLDVSPLAPRPGQQLAQTELVPPNARNTMYASVGNRIAAGGQVFVVCPRVEAPPGEERTPPEVSTQGSRSSTPASAKADREEMRAVESEYKRLQHDLFKELRIERLHGKMKAEEKLRIIAAFRDRQVDLLVASTVVEVGVDIPGADTLLVEGAERFGLATLHQLRGRIGRRGQSALCYLATETDDPAALDRLQVLVRSTSGLEIAEEDLRRRGQGDLYGTRQHGGVWLKVADLADLDFLLRVRSAAERLLVSDPALTTAPLLAARVSQRPVTTHFE